PRRTLDPLVQAGLAEIHADHPRRLTVEDQREARPPRHAAGPPRGLAGRPGLRGRPGRHPAAGARAATAPAGGDDVGAAELRLTQRLWQPPRTLLARGRRG